MKNRKLNIKNILIVSNFIILISDLFINNYNDIKNIIFYILFNVLLFINLKVLNYIYFSNNKLFMEDLDK